MANIVVRDRFRSVSYRSRHVFLTFDITGILLILSSQTRQLTLCDCLTNLNNFSNFASRDPVGCQRSLRRRAWQFVPGRRRGTGDSQPGHSPARSPLLRMDTEGRQEVDISISSSSCDHEGGRLRFGRSEIVGSHLEEKLFKPLRPKT